MDATVSTISSASDSLRGHLKSDHDSARFSSGEGVSSSRRISSVCDSSSSPLHLKSDRDSATTLSPSGEGVKSSRRLSAYSTLPLHLKNKNSRVQELTINKLRYDDVKFVGRAAESEILRSRLERIMTATSSSEDQQYIVEASGSLMGMTIMRNKEMVLIKGYSGCGKSALASKLKDWTSEMENGIVVQGKFEITTTTPYSGVCQAFAAICNKLKLEMESDIESKKASAMKIGDELISELGSDLQEAVSLIPELRSILPNDYEDRISGRFEEDENFEAAQEQWKNAFRVLIRVFGSCFSPLVLILDDLQWADMASLSVIEFLLTDAQNPNPLMVVGCYRSNEVDDKHELTRMISSLAEKTEKGTLKLTEIELGNVSPKDANQVVMANR